MPRGLDRLARSLSNSQLGPRLIDRSVAGEMLTPIVDDLTEAGCEIRGDRAAQDTCKSCRSDHMVCVFMLRPSF